ncbi:MAG: hypothetical protein ACPG4X_14520 [Pikeienuella sp.]
MKDGGPAFPSEFVLHEPGKVGNEVAIKEFSSGMSLRDWFAGQALVGVMTNAENFGGAASHEREEAFRRTADLLYEIADAMLAARDKATGAA